MAVEQFRVDGDVAVVTDVSSDIGESSAKRFADDVEVVICSCEHETVDPVAEAINESERPGRALALKCDVTDREAVEWASDDVRVNCIALGFVATEGVEAQMGVSTDEIDRERVERRIGGRNRRPNRVSHRGRNRRT